MSSSLCLSYRACVTFRNFANLDLAAVAPGGHSLVNTLDIGESNAYSVSGECRSKLPVSREVRRRVISSSSPLSCGCLVHVHVHVNAAVPLFARTEAALVPGARPAVTVICVCIVSSLTCLLHTLLYLSSSWRHIPLCAAPHSVLEHDAAHSGDHFTFTLVIQPRCLRAASAALLLSRETPPSRDPRSCNGVHFISFWLRPSLTLRHPLRCCVIFSSRARRRLSSMGNSHSRSPVVKVARPVVTATRGRLLVFVLFFAHRVQGPARIRPIVVHCNDVVPLLAHTAATLVSYSVRDPLLRSRICPVHISDAVPLFARSVAALVLVARPAVTVTRGRLVLVFPSCKARRSRDSRLRGRAPLVGTTAHTFMCHVAFVRAHDGAFVHRQLALVQLPRPVSDAVSVHAHRSASRTRHTTRCYRNIRVPRHPSSSRSSHIVCATLRLHYNTYLLDRVVFRSEHAHRLAIESSFFRDSELRPLGPLRNLGLHDTSISWGLTVLVRERCIKWLEAVVIEVFFAPKSTSSWSSSNSTTSVS
ncbi:hypothetical protein B0H11DRAFT_2233155 [Mycena galericulata]|nr:hypothetical protein B0H11DRAFT_2233155 [Mycena galericulata]